LPLLNDARRFEEATINVAGAIGFGAALEMLLGIGLDKIEARILDLTGRLIEGLLAKGYLLRTPHTTRSERSGIVSFYHQHHALDGLMKRLTEARMVVSQRGSGIRVSPHFYNTEDEIDRLLEALP
jgi:selenocysteine lyase/cysteine desulfurase